MDHYEVEVLQKMADAQSRQAEAAVRQASALERIAKALERMCNSSVEEEVVSSVSNLSK